MQKISYKKYFSNILWFTSTNLLAFVFLVPSIIDLFRDESSVAFGQPEEETEDGKFVRWLFRALTFFINLLREISGFVLSMSASILDYSINFATVFILKNILGGGPVYEVWSSVRDIGNLLIILFLGIIAVSLISGIFGQVTKKSVVWILGAALLINFSGTITTLVYTSGTVISKGFLTKSEGLIISSKRGKTRTSCEKGVAKCISAAVSVTSLDESRYEAELFKKVEEAESDHKKRANAYYEKLAKDKKLTNEQIDLLKSVTFSGETLSSLSKSGLRKEYIALGNKGIKPYHAFNKKAAEDDFNSKNQTDRKRFIIGLISFGLNIVLIVAFLYAALSLLYVGIGIVFLYIISPLGLVSHMITKTGIKSNILEVIKNAWWSNLWGYTFFAPVFLGGLWIAISIYSAFRETLSLVGGRTNLLNEAVVGLILMVIMLLKSMEIANNVSGDVGGFIKGVKDKSLKTVKKLGVAGLVGGVALGAFKSTRDLVGHGMHKVSNGRFATQAHLRHNKRKTEAKNFLKYGLTGKNSGARGDREMEEARKEFEKKQDLSSFNILKAKEKEIHGRLGTVQSAESTEAYREIEESLKAKAKDKKTKDEELAKLMTARNIAKEDVKDHENADGRTRLQKRKAFLDSKEAIEQYKRDNPDAFDYHEQARKHKADKLHRREEMHKIGREKQSLIEENKKLSYDTESLYKSNPKTKKAKKARLNKLEDFGKKQKQVQERFKELLRKEKEPNKTSLSSNIKGQQLKIEEKELKMRNIAHTGKESIHNLNKETDKELNESKGQIDTNDNIRQQKHKWNKNLLKQKKRQILSDRIKSARDTLKNHDGNLISKFVNASKKAVGHGEESQIKEINKEIKTLNKERKGFKNKKEKDIENMYKEVEKKTAHQTDLINKERKEAGKKIEHLVKNEREELKKDLDTQDRLYKKAKESIKEKFVFDDHTKHLEKTGDFSTKKDGDKKKDKKS